MSLECLVARRHNAKTALVEALGATIELSACWPPIFVELDFGILSFTMTLLASLAIAMADRYFSDAPLTGEQAILGGSEAHHLLHVMRAKVGAEIIVFDGRGGEWWAVVTKLGRTDVELALRKHRPIERELPIEFTLAVSLPKGDRQRWLVEKCVELGVAKLAPLTSSRSTVSATEPPAKLARYVVEASKQCGRNRLMEIAKPRAWDLFVSQTLEANKLIAHPGGIPVNEINRQCDLPVLLAIGPEGGFTDDEVQSARDHGWQVVGLGERILRIETAAMALVARLAVI
jgi:16S rRNA (uracil1498-N3)-methyltransferase